MVEASQVLTVGLAFATLPVLLVLHVLGRRRRLGLVAAALGQGMSWWMLCLLVAPQAVGSLGASDWVAGGAVLGALWLGWFEVYSVLCRGFSLQLLVELQDRPGTQADLAAAYANGRGLDWMLEKRVRGLLTSRLCRRSTSAEGPAAQYLELTPPGRLLATAAGLYKRLVGIGAGG